MLAPSPERRRSTLSFYSRPRLHLNNNHTHPHHNAIQALRELRINSAVITPPIQHNTGSRDRRKGSNIEDGSEDAARRKAWRRTVCAVQIGVIRYGDAGKEIPCNIADDM